jgi:hypothetical protein
MTWEVMDATLRFADTAAVARTTRFLQEAT